MQCLLLKCRIYCYSTDYTGTVQIVLLHCKGYRYTAKCTNTPQIVMLQCKVHRSEFHQKLSHHFFNICLKKGRAFTPPPLCVGLRTRARARAKNTFYLVKKCTIFVFNCLKSVTIYFLCHIKTLHKIVFTQLKSHEKTILLHIFFKFLK